MRYGQLVIGPAGSGKSTYCATFQEHCKVVGRTVFVVNLDPAAEQFRYECSIDIRAMLSVDEVLEASKEAREIMGPNGALVYCTHTFSMEYLIDHLDWLHEQLDALSTDDDYLLFDCPGQIELYSHLPIMRQIVDALRQWGFNICSTFLMDTQFCLDSDKFLAAALTSLSSIVALETPAINVLSKMDLLGKEDTEFVEMLMDGDISSLLPSANANNRRDLPSADGEEGSSSSIIRPWDEKYRQLSEQISSVLDDYSLVKFMPLNPEDEDMVSDLVLAIDAQIQYGEDLETRDRYPVEVDRDEEEEGEDRLNGS